MNHLFKKKWQIYLDFFGARISRTEEFIKKEYCEVWTKKQQKLYDFSLASTPVEINGRILFQTALEDRRLQLEEFAKIISNTQPKTVLELGAGSGLNLICLALLFPHIKFTGVELTEEGRGAFESLLANPPIKVIQYLIGSFSGPIPEVDFHVGNMLSLPYQDKSFDLVYSNMSIEQLPRDYIQAFKEAKRVTRDWCVFNEGFADFQNFFQKLQRKKLDYFLGNTISLQRLGFKIVSARIPFSNIIYTNAFVVCKII